MIDVLANDSDIDSPSFIISGFDITGTQGSPVEESGQVRFTPSANFFGITSFDYTIFDNVDGFATATVTITVNPVNDDPIAQPDSIAVPKDDPGTTIDVLGNDVDPAWWDDGLLPDQDFVNGIQWLIKNGIMKIQINS